MGYDAYGIKVKVCICINNMAYYQYCGSKDLKKLDISESNHIIDNK